MQTITRIKNILRVKVWGLQKNKNYTLQSIGVSIFVISLFILGISFFYNPNWYFTIVGGSLFIFSMCFPVDRTKT